MARPSTRRPGLADYDAKRDFARTPEPAGARPTAGSGPGGMFVVQRHRARALHYDLRLEVEGVLASWAVPKGPTLDPSRRSLAVQVEDHPMEYADFEGVIPSGEYGGGDVIVWDRGTWAPARDGDPAAAIAGGELHFDLRGEKLAGRFVLVRTGADGRGRNQWLLLHKADDAAQRGWDPEDHPASVKSGRTNDEVRADPDALWHGDRPASEAEEQIRRGRGAGRAAGRLAVPRRGRVPQAELRRLDELADGGRWAVRGHRLELRALDDVVVQGHRGEPPVTVRDLVRYHAQAAPALLPYLADRPAVVARHRAGGPAGASGEGLVDEAPRWITRWRAPRGGDGRSADRGLVIDEPAALAWVAGERGVEIHPAVATAEAPDAPTWAVIEIRPGRATGPDDVALLGRLHRTALDHLGLAGGAKTDGRGGLEVWIPLRPGPSFAAVGAWAADLVRSIGASVPDLVRDASRSGGRSRPADGRARLVHRQSFVRPAVVVPYGVVARRGAPVSVPLVWRELDDPEVLGRGSIHDVPARLDEVGDPFAPLVGLDQDLPPL